MDFIKKHPVFSAVIACCIIVFIVETVLVFNFQTAADKAQKKYKRSLNDRNAVIQFSPKPTEQTLSAVNNTIAELEEALQKRRQLIENDSLGDIAEGAPQSSDNMLIEIRDYIEKYRSQANARVDRQITDENFETVVVEGPRIKIAQDFSFGFHYYDAIRKKGPPAENIREVYTQLRVLDFLMRELFEAEPAGITSVKRDPIVALDTSGKQNAITQYRDVFLINPLTSARQPGAIKTMAFEISFTGYTKSLRHFLTQMRTFNWPLVVRNVEVKPQVIPASNKPNRPKNRQQNLFAQFGIGDDSAERSEDEKYAKAKEPVVNNNVSEFTVTIELIQLDYNKDTEADDLQKNG